MAIGRPLPISTERGAVSPRRILINMDYQLYIKSEQWKRIAEKVKERAKYRCQVCAETANLAAHHNSYENLGDEENHMEDLVCLCRRCHEKHHGKTGRPRVARYKRPEPPISRGCAKNLSAALSIPIPKVYDIPPRIAETMEVLLARLPVELRRIGKA
jgi:hypothetical protein